MSQKITKRLSALSSLPGIGKRSSQRLILHLMQENQIDSLLQSLQEIKSMLRFCNQCGNLDECSPCNICMNTNRISSILCLVKSVTDIWTLENAGCFAGQYFIISQKSPASMEIDPNPILDRVKDLGAKEVICAFDASVSNHVVISYISDILKSAMPEIIVTSLARGVPFGGELSNLDEITLQSAMTGRKSLD